MAYVYQEFPKVLYHPTLAPEGKTFQSADETKGLADQGWVDTPAKFPKASQRDVAQAAEGFDAAEQEYRFWTTGGRCEPQSNKWEEVTARYNAARDKYNFALQEESRLGTAPKKQAVTSKSTQQFETVFGTYTVEGPIGQGGTGRVFAVRHEDGRQWALKTLDAKSVTRKRLQRFKNEIGFCSKNIHPNIVPVMDWGLADGPNIGKIPFYVMPKFEDTLRRLMRAGLDHDRVLRLFDQVLAGLEAAHGLGVWHRDLKPENVLYDRPNDQLLVADFGIAHFADPLLRAAIETSQHDRLANFQYAAPEQRAFGKVDHQADIYALGMILNEMFTRELLQGTGYRRIESVAPKYGYLDFLVDRMVRQDPNERPSSIQEVRAALRPDRIQMEVKTGDAGASPQSEMETVEAAKKSSTSQTSEKRSSSEDVFETLEMHLYAFADSRYPEAAFVDSYQLSLQFEIKVGYINEFLEGLHREGFLSLAKWDGTRERPLHEWPSSAAFFDYSADGGMIRVRMRQRGKQQLERMKATRRN
jgi:serine/threonine protein kinase